MKKLGSVVKLFFKFFLYTTSCILLFGLMYLAAFFVQYWLKEKRLNKITHVSIGLGENIKELKSVDLIICDSTYNFSKKNLEAGISENLAISDKTFPCSITVKYIYSNGKTKLLSADSLGMPNNEGANSLTLWKDSVGTKEYW